VGVVEVSVAIDDYEHVRALADGDVRVPGATFTFHRLPTPSEIFHRQFRFGEWDVSEMSLALYCGMRSAGDERFVAIPVFPLRRFRHSCVFVAASSPLRRLEDLAGRRVGVPEWGQTAGVWVRGILEDDHGVGLGDVEWVQGGVAEVGRPEHLHLALPPGVRLGRVADAPLIDKLLAGELDAIVSALFPQELLASGRCRPLLADWRAAELDYYDRTGIVPIMHLVVVRREVHEAHRWLAKELVKAFDAAKARALERLCSAQASLYPVPHLAEVASELVGRFGGDPWPYGLEANRHALATFLRYAAAQGLLERELGPEELFAPSSIDVFHA